MRFYRATVLVLGLLGAGGILACIAFWPRHGGQFYAPISKWMIAFLIYAAAFSYAAWLVRPVSGRELAFRITACLILLQMLVYALFWVSLAGQELAGVSPYQKILSWVRVQHIGWHARIVPKMVLLLGPLLLPGIVRSMKNGSLLAALEFSGSALILAFMADDPPFS